MSEEHATKLLTEARDTYFFLNNAWEIARLFGDGPTDRLYKLSLRAWERMLRRGKLLSAVRMQGVLS